MVPSSLFFELEFDKLEFQVVCTNIDWNLSLTNLSSNFQNKEIFDYVNRKGMEAREREREREDLKGSGGELVCDLKLQGLDQIRILKSFTSFAQNW